MNFSKYWDVALISTIKIPICDHVKLKISVLIGHLLQDVDYSWNLKVMGFFSRGIIGLYWVVHLEASQYNLTSKKRFTNRPLYTTAMV